jgi:hypothetical protein
MSEAANNDRRTGFAVGPDAEHDTYEEALAIAQELKRVAPEMLVTVWDLAAGKGPFGMSCRVFSQSTLTQAQARSIKGANNGEHEI